MLPLLYMACQIVRDHNSTAWPSCTGIFDWADDCLLYVGPQSNGRYSPIRSAALLIRVWRRGINPTDLVLLGQHEGVALSRRIARRIRPCHSFCGWAGA